MKRFLSIGIAALLVACAEKAPTPEFSRGAADRQPAQRPIATADSARAFVQRFYEWYLATEARHGSPYDSLMTTRHGWLADTLASALKADVAFQRADTAAEIASLSAEADVFLNSQDPCARYTAGAPRPLGAGGFTIAVVGDCAGRDARPNLEVEVQPRGAEWMIANLRDPTDPSFDLLSAFARYRAEILSPGEKAGRDTSRAGPT